jgi:hypothetical protein
MIQHLEINKYNTAQKQNQGQKSYDNLKEKAFDKIQHLFMVKALKKLGLEGMNLKIIMVIYDKSIVNIIIIQGKWRSFPRRPEQDNIVHSFLLHRELDFLRQGKEFKGTQIGKGDFKVFKFSVGIILFLKDPKDCTQKTSYN